MAQAPLSALHTADRRILDAEGRDVLLRGANVNGLAEYWAGRPELPPVFPIDDADWDLMAGYGFTAVRLLISWSRLEPERGSYDAGYLDEVDTHVRKAAERGIYTVIDMHQDVYSPYIFTRDPSAVPAGATPARGWDGAPTWAVISDDEPSLTLSENRASNPAARRAWEHLYRDTDGIRTAFADAWGVVAERFAGRSEVAGYDILNEPENVFPAAETQPLYDELLAQCVRRIRAAETGKPGRLIFIEPALPCEDHSRGLVHPSPAAFDHDPIGIVYAPHNYTESLPAPTTYGLRTEAYNTVLQRVADDLDVPVWIGEYGVFGTDEANVDLAWRYAADEDRRLWGGAWWVWRQSYGDPHRLVWGDGGWGPTPVDEAVRLHTTAAATNEDAPTTPLLEVLGRAFPRATPGRLTLVESARDGRFAMHAHAAAPGSRVEIWYPHRVGLIESSNIIDLKHDADARGQIITATVAGSGHYHVSIRPAPRD